MPKHDHYLVEYDVKGVTVVKRRERLKNARKLLNRTKGGKLWHVSYGVRKELT